MTWAHLIDAAWDRFVSKLDTSRGPDGCWPWMGARTHGQGNSAPYGSFGVGPIPGEPRRWFVVRITVFLAAAVGEYVPGMHRDHTCKNTLCCNPAHAETVTPRVNSLRRWGK